MTIVLTTKPYYLDESVGFTRIRVHPMIHSTFNRTE